MSRSPVRMPAGINNVDYTASPLGTSGEANYNGARNSHPLFMYPAPDPFRLVYDGDDFINTPNAASYVTTVVGTGSAASISGIGGLWRLATSAGGTDSVSWQHSSADVAYNSTAQGWYHTRVIASDATASELLMGVINTTTTPLTATDGFYFHKASGAATVDLVVKNASTATTIATGIATMVNATAIKLSLYYDGRGTLSYYVDNVKVGQYTDTTKFPLSTVPLAPTFYILNAAAAIKTLDVDYYLVATELVR